MWRQTITGSGRYLCCASFSTKKAERGKTGSERQHMRSGQSRNDLELNQKPDLINHPYFIRFSMISLLLTATSTTIQRLKRPAWLCLNILSELRGLSLTVRCAGADGRYANFVSDNTWKRKGSFQMTLGITNSRDMLFEHNNYADSHPPSLSQIIT